jgi:hypothetical protein
MKRGGRVPDLHRMRRRVMCPRARRNKEKDGGLERGWMLQTLYARPFKYCFPGSSSAVARGGGRYEGWKGVMNATRTHLAEVGAVALAGSLGSGDLVGAAGGGGAAEGDVGAGGRDLYVSLAL